jgi:hypothetical protein
MTQYEIIYPTLDLFLYDLREAVSNEKNSESHNSFRQFLKDILNNIELEKDQPDAEFHYLLASKNHPFEKPLDGYYFPVQLGDTYSLQVDYSGKVGDPLKKSVHEIAELKKTILKKIKEKSPTLGQTWLLWGQLALDQQDAKETAKECYKNLIPTGNWDQNFQRQGQYLGADIFELWQSPQSWTTDWHEFSKPDTHTIIILFPANQDIEEIKKIVPKYHFDWMRLLCYYHKIIFAYSQGSYLSSHLKKQNKTAKNSLNLSNLSQNLDSLRENLTKSLQTLSDYQEDLINLQSQIYTLEINTKNYESRLAKLIDTTKEKGELTFSQDFSQMRFNPQKYREQLEANQHYLNAGLARLENRIRNIEGIINIEQTKSEQTLAYTVGIVGLGLAASGITATIASTQISEKKLSVYEVAGLSILVLIPFILLWWIKIRKK